MTPENDLLDYYRDEIAYLRVQGGEFAARYPKIAQRLLLSASESPDPHTERLMESFAFLTARVHRDVDGEFPAISGALLESTCPNLVHPVPSLSIAQMDLNPSQGKVTAGLKVPRDTGLWAFAASGQTCRFKTAADVELWPLRISRVALEQERMLKLSFEAVGGVDVSELTLDKLAIHLSGDLLVTMPLHDLLVSGLEGIELLTGSGNTHKIAPSKFAELGHGIDELAVPNPRNGHPAYALLQQYFSQPRLFQFFELSGLKGLLGTGKTFSIRLVFDRSSPTLQNLSAENFKIGCVPIANLFEQTSEPITLTQKEYEYRLIPDFQREDTVEIHSVQSIFVTDPEIERPIVIPNVFAGADESGESDVFWTSRREVSLRTDMTGCDVYLGLVNNLDEPKLPASPVIYAKTLCTNRRLAEMVPAGTKLVGQNISTSIAIKNLYQPSPQEQPKVGKRALWNLVSILRLNHQSLLDSTHGLEHLKDLLMLFAGDSASNQGQIRGIKSLITKPATLRKGTDVWRGVCTGTDIAIEFDDDAFVGASPLLFSRVLLEFLSLYTTVNSFVRLTVYRRGQIWASWPALGGGQCVM